MRTTLVMASAISAIITASVLTFALPNQVFAQLVRDPSDTITKGERGLLAGHEAQAGKVLSGEEAEVAKIIPGKLDVVFPTGGPIKP